MAGDFTEVYTGKMTRSLGLVSKYFSLNRGVRGVLRENREKETNKF